MRIKAFLEKIISAVFPSVTCISCNEELSSDKEREFCLCGKCREKMQFCGEKENFIQNKKLYFSRYFSVFIYDDIARRLVLNFKDGNKPYLGKNIAKFLFSVYKEKDIICDYITYVPSSKSKKARRGYDPMKIVASSFSRLSGLESLSVLGRKNKGLDQTEAKDRYANIEGQYYYDSPVNIKNKTVLLLDDVVTTGATAGECSKQLLQAGVKEVILLTFTEAKSFENYRNIVVNRMEKHTEI